MPPYGCRRVLRVLTCLAGHTPCRKIVSRNEPYVVRKCSSSSSCALDSSQLFGTVHCYYYDTGYGFYRKFSVQFLHLKPKLRNSQNKCAHISLSREREGGLQLCIFGAVLDFVPKVPLHALCAQASRNNPTTLSHLLMMSSLDSVVVFTP